MLLVASGLFAMFFFNSLYIQRVLGYGPLKAGLAFLPFTAGIMVSAGLASGFAPKIGVRLVVGDRHGRRGRRHAAADADPGRRHLRQPTCCRRSCSPRSAWARVFVSLTLVATTGLEDEDQGLASGLFNTSQQIGGALGLAILSHDRREPDRRCARSRRRQLVHGFHWAFAGSAVFVLAGLVRWSCCCGSRRRADRAGRRAGPRGDVRMTLRADAQRNLDRLLDAAAEVLRRARRSTRASTRSPGVPASGTAPSSAASRRRTRCVAAVIDGHVRALTALAEEVRSEPGGFERFVRAAAAAFAQNRALIEGINRCRHTPQVEALTAAAAEARPQRAVRRRGPARRRRRGRARAHPDREPLSRRDPRRAPPAGALGRHSTPFGGLRHHRSRGYAPPPALPIFGNGAPGAGRSAMNTNTTSAGTAGELRARSSAVGADVFAVTTTFVTNRAVNV